MSALVKFGGDTVDMFFGQEPFETNWDEIIAGVDKIYPATEVAAIQAHEPLTPGHPYEHHMWVHQQRLRLALRHAQGLPLTDGICPACGKREKDAVLDSCLPCFDIDRQLPRNGSRGSCSFLKPIYDPRDRVWGIAYYWDSHDDTIMIWVAKGFSSFKEAWIELYPVKLYENWLARRYSGIGNFWNLGHDLVDLTWMIKNKDKVPFKPSDFRSYLKSRIGEHMVQDHELVESTTSSAISDFNRKNDS